MGMAGKQLSFDRRVMAPGSRGGKFFLTDTGRVRYGVPTFASGSSSPAEFGGFADAGAPIGTVANRLSRRMQAEVATYANRGGHVFVDSGAFGAFRKQETLDFERVFAVYDDLVRMTKKRSGLHLVMPDVIGSQSETFALQERYGDKIRDYIRAGVDVMLPIQLGELSPAECMAHLRNRFGDNFTVAVPSNEAAFSGEQLSNLAGAKPARIHLLGIGASAKLKGLVKLIRAKSPDTLVTSDANRLRAWIGEGRDVTRLVKPRLDEGLHAGLGGSGEFAEYDETEAMGYARDWLSHADYQHIAETFQMDGGWREAKRSVEDGSVHRFGDWYDHLLMRLWEQRAKRSIQPALRRQAIAEVAREKL